MKSLNELDVACRQVLEAATSLRDDHYKEVNEQAPSIVHQRLCSEFSNLLRENPDLAGKPLEENSQGAKIIDAIRILKEFYPSL